MYNEINVRFISENFFRRLIMLYIITTGDYELIEQIATDIMESRNDVSIIHTGRICCSKIKKIESYLLCMLGVPVVNILSDTVINEISNIKEKDSVLLWFSETMPEIFAVSSLITSKKKSVWLWNTMSHNLLKSMLLVKLKKWMNFYTFDEEDAKKFGIKYKTQVCYDIKKFISNSKISTSTDLYFCGVDKGRYKIIADLYYNLLAQGLKCDFNIVPDKHSKNIIVPELKSNGIGLIENVERLNSTKCVLEIMKKGQRGLTLRTLEAMILGKKLITNNKYITNFSFYSPENILIIQNIFDAKQIADFINSTTYNNNQPGWFEKYMPTSWVKDFI